MVFDGRCRQFLILSRVLKFLAAFALRATVLNPFRTGFCTPAKVCNEGRYSRDNAVGRKARRFRLNVFVSRSIAVYRRGLLPVGLANRQLAVGDRPTLFFRMVAAPSIVVASGRVRLRSRVNRLKGLPRRADVTFQRCRFRLMPGIRCVSRRMRYYDVVFCAVRGVRRATLLYPPIYCNAEAWVYVKGRVCILRGLAGLGASWVGGPEVRGWGAAPYPVA